MNKKYPVGIDLGTSCSCIGVWKEGSVTIIQDSQKNRTMPSYVAFTDTECLVGHDAYNQAHENPQNTIFGVKRMLGRDYSDPAIKENTKNWPFKIINDSQRPVLQVQYQRKAKKVAPVEISSMVLKKLKSLAEAHIGEGNATYAVITVPAYFDHAQIDATIKAGIIAGFKEIKTISEPTAAAIAYGLDRKTKKEETIVVFDMGAGTLDVTLMSVTEQKFIVLATNGNTNLGGNDFDNKLYDYFYRIFENDITDNQKAKASLRLHCEKIKKVLSTNVKSEEFVLTLENGKELTCKITREKFEEICEDLFKACLVPLEKIIEDNKSKKKIDQVVLAGGMTRVPKIVKLVREFFEGININNTINADEAIAHGATVRAAVAYGAFEESLFDFLLMDVTPLSLGIEVKGGIMVPVIQRNTTIPIRIEHIFKTSEDNQSAVDFSVYQGERELTKDNKLLGTFTIYNLPRKPKGQIKFKTSLDISSNGTLEVTAVETSKLLSSNIIIAKESRDLTQEDVERMIIDADTYYTQDKKEKDKIQAKLQLQDFCYNLKKSLMNDKNICEQDKQSFFKRLAETDAWSNQCEGLNSQVCEAKKNELTHFFNTIVAKNSKMSSGLIGTKGVSLRLEDLA